MWEAISTWGGWNEVGAAGAWLVALCLLAIGLAGCLLPVIPGPLIISGVRTKERAQSSRKATQSISFRQLPVYVRIDATADRMFDGARIGIGDAAGKTLSADASNGRLRP